MQDIAIVTMEGKQETARNLSNGSIQRQITQKRYKIAIFTMAPFSMTLNNP